MAQMTVEELAVRASLQLVILDNNSQPISFGSGCIILYKEKHFLLSVAHVTDVEDYTIAVETGLPPNDRGVPLQPDGGFYHFDMFNIADPSIIAEVADLFKNGERLDISFAEVKITFPLLQAELDFGAFKVSSGGKAILEVDDVIEPSKGKKYYFFGRVKHHYTGTSCENLPHLQMESTLKYGMEYHSPYAKYHRFLTREIISNADDYRGCSGAPILDENGFIVALTCAVRPNSRFVYGFPLGKCLELIDYAMKIENLQANE